jgi:putative ABC transport system permease protein
MASLLQDLRFGLRLLCRNPGFTVVALVALALGIGANTAIFSVVSAVLLRPLPYPEPDRLVWIWAHSPTRGIPFHFFLYADFVGWRRQARSFESMSAYFPKAVTVSSGEPERVTGLQVNAGFLRVFGVRPILGRDFVEEDDQPGARRVCLISHGLWQRRLGSDPNLIGSAVRLDGSDYTVVGVLPPGFQVVGMPAHLYMPLALAGSRSGADRYFSVGALARLKPGVTKAQAQAETNALAGQLNEAYFRTSKRGLRLWGLREFLVRDVQTSVRVLAGAAALVLLVACANVANLVLARTVVRRKELAVRATLGAGRLRIVRQLVTESSLLSLLGGGLGLALAHWGVQLLVAAGPARYPMLREARLDAQALWFSLGISLLTGMLFGLTPALSVTKAGLQEALQEEGRGSGESIRGTHLRSVLVVSEVALALLLAIGAGLLLKALLRLQEVRPGFNAAEVLTAGITLPGGSYASQRERQAFFQQLLPELERLPGVRAAGMVSALPLGPINTGTLIHVEGRPAPRPEDAPAVWVRSATASYFRALEIPLLRGRHFSEQDSAAAPRVALINQTMARRFWPKEDPVGKRLAAGLTHGQQTPWITVVGVVGDIRHTSLAQPPQPEFFLPYPQHPETQMFLAIRTTADPSGFAPVLRAAVAGVDKEQPISEVGSLEHSLADSIAPRRFAVLLVGAFAGLAVALAAVGIYGVTSFVVTRRRHEIGVRLALGAAGGEVLRLIVGQGMSLTALGLGIGWAAAWALTRILRSLLFGITATDPLIFGVVPVLLAAVTALACYLPARRAMRIAPVAALRHQ